MLVALLLLTAQSNAQGLDQGRPDVAASTTAAENGPGTLWVNPANLAYDPDPRYGVYLRYEDWVGGRDSIAATAGIQGLQVGLHNRLLPAPRTADGVRSEWSLDYGTSIPLPERLSFGFLVSWNFIEAGTNYVSYDAGASWRPLPWFGVSTVAQNVGDPDPSGLTQPRTAAGVALRPIGDLFVLGVDYSRSFPSAALPARSGDGHDTVRSAVRVHPVEGLYLRGDVDISVLPTVAVQSAGVGVEVFFDGLGGGYYQGFDPDGQRAFSGFVGTDEPGESLITPGRQAKVLDLSYAPAYEPRATLLMLDPGPSWLDVIERLRRTEEDRRIEAVVIQLRGPGLSWARWQELRERIVALRASGKTVLAYLDGSAGNGAWYAATGADRIAMHPGGDLSLVGLSLEMQHLRGLLDLVGIEPQFVRRSEYKGGPETFTRTEPSEANLEAMETLIDDLYQGLVRVAAERAGGEAEARAWIDAGPWTARDARDAGLVDTLTYPEALYQQLEEMVGGPVNARDLVAEPQPRSPWDHPAKIAIVYVDGPIVEGESSSGGLLGGKTAGAATIVRALKRAREDPLVRAVVLRVDSPGGSALASDRIWEAAERVQKDGKPVVVSMGGVAASGGYYVAAGADAIWAEEDTITGSIGVYGGKFVTAELFDNVGVATTAIVRGRNADLFSMNRPWDAMQREKVQSMVDETYRRFKKVVSDGRGLTVDEVEEIARGRVWSGARAVEIGLVDEIGSFHHAIADARVRAGIRPQRTVGLVSYSPGGSLLESLAPSVVGRLLGPFDDLLVKTAAPADPTDPLADLLPDLAGAWVQAQNPQTLIWMMDPWLVDATTR